MSCAIHFCLSELGFIFIKEIDVNENVLCLMRLDTFEAAAKGKATRIIIHSQSQSFAGFAASFKEISASVMKSDSTRKYKYFPLCRIQA